VIWLARPQHRSLWVFVPIVSLRAQKGPSWLRSTSSEGNLLRTLRTPTRVAFLVYMRLYTLISALGLSCILAGCYQSTSSEANFKQFLSLFDDCKTLGEQTYGISNKADYSSASTEHFYSPKLKSCVSVRYLRHLPSPDYPSGKEQDIIFDTVPQNVLFEYGCDTAVQSTCLSKLDFTLKVKELRGEGSR
jgi:hypothetical protein